MVERPMGDCESERSEKGFWGETVAYHKEFVDAIFRMDCWGKTERSIVRLPDVNGQVNLLNYRQGSGISFVFLPNQRSLSGTRPLVCGET